MIFQTHVPHGPLSASVDYFWYFTGCNPPGAKELNLPEGTLQLIVNLQDDCVQVHDRYGRFTRLEPAVVCGPRSDFFVMDNADRRMMMGVQFKPGKAVPFLGAPACEAADLILPLDDLWGLDAALLREQLLHASSLMERFGILEQYLVARMDCCRQPNALVEHALRRFRHFPHLQSVRDTVRSLHLSPKKFIRLFKHEVGMSPKRYCRLMRFQHALNLVRHSGDVNWTEIALMCGYYDQSHFIKEFQAFSGLTPSAYRLKQSMHPSHVPLL
jgi:AraC-like DNA-binding protein